MPKQDRWYVEAYHHSHFVQRGVPQVQAAPEPSQQNKMSWSGNSDDLYPNELPTQTTKTQNSIWDLQELERVLKGPQSEKERYIRNRLSRERAMEEELKQLREVIKSKALSLPDEVVRDDLETKRLKELEEDGAKKDEELKALKKTLSEREEETKKLKAEKADLKGLTRDLRNLLKRYDTLFERREKKAKKKVEEVKAERVHMLELVQLLVDDDEEENGVDMTPGQPNCSQEILDVLRSCITAEEMKEMDD